MNLIPCLLHKAKLKASENIRIPHIKRISRESFRNASPKFVKVIFKHAISRYIHVLLPFFSSRQSCIPFFSPIPCIDICCPWSHVLRPKKLQASVAVPPAPVRVPSQRPLAPSVASVTSVTSVANDKGDNEMILEAVHRSPGICLTAEENSRKPQLGDRLMKGLCENSLPQMGSLLSK